MKFSFNNFGKFLLVPALIAALTLPQLSFAAQKTIPTKMPEPLKLNGKNIGSLELVNEGAKLLAAGQTQQAEAVLGEALLKNPDSPEAAYNFGLALAFNGKFYDAIQANFKALELKQQFAEAHLALGNLFLTMGDLEQALNAFDHATHLSPGPFITRAALFNKAVALGRLKRFAEAELAFSECLAATPDDQSIPFQLAEMNLRQGKPESALKWLDTMNEEYLVESNLMRAKAYIALKDSKKAKQALATSKKLLVNDVELKTDKDLNRIIGDIEKEIENIAKND